VNHTVTFASRLAYDRSQPNITVPTRLRVGKTLVGADAKLDTGSSYCIYAREVGEGLGLDIEAGDRMKIETVRGSFVAFGHGVTLEAAGLEFDAVVYFAAEHGFPRNVLGRAGFIDRLRLGVIKCSEG
jgi:hypothetical protein